MHELSDDWTVGRRLGAGGMGEVYEAVHERLAHRVAVKFIPDAPDSFDAEVRAIARLDHPQIVRIYDQGRSPRPWILMERCVGTLGMPGSWDELRSKLDQLLLGVAVTHAHGLLHLDIKPSNVLVRADGSLALADFGIAAFEADRNGWRPRGGSLRFMAPERFDGGGLGPWTDLYSVGVLAWLVATGLAPWSCPTWTDARQAHVHGVLPAFVPRVPVPVGFEGWLRSLLASSPNERVGSAALARHRLMALGDPLVTFGHRPAQVEATATLTRTMPVGEAVPTAVVASRAPMEGVPIPAAWPTEPSARRPESVGFGLLDLLEPPFVRHGACEALWEVLRGGGGCVALVGPRGVGRTRTARAFAAAACAYAGAQRADEPGPGRTVVVLDDAEAVPDALRHPQAGTTVVVVPTGSCALGDLPRIPVRPLSPRAVRQVLATWCGLVPEVVAHVEERCGTDLGAAVALVRHGVEIGALRPGPLGIEAVDLDALELSSGDDVPDSEGALLAAAFGEPLLAGQAPELDRAIQSLAAAGLVGEGEDRWHWTRASARRRILAQASDAARRAAHERCAGWLGDDRWRRGQQLLAAGDVEQAVEDLYASGSLAIARGEMARATRLVAALSPLVSDPLSEARLAMLMSHVGPTFQGYDAVRAHNERAIERTAAILDDPRAHQVHCSALKAMIWLNQVTYDPWGGLQAYRRLREVASGPIGRENYGYLALMVGDTARAQQTFAAAEASATGIRGRATTAFMRVICEALMDLEHDHSEALERARVAVVDEAGIESARADGWQSVAYVLRLQGRLDEAEACLAQASLAIAGGQARADPSGDALMGLVARGRGDLEAARGYLRRALAKTEPVGLRASMELHLATVMEPMDLELAVGAVAVLGRTRLFDLDMAESLELLGIEHGLGPMELDPA